MFQFNPVKKKNLFSSISFDVQVYLPTSWVETFKVYDERNFMQKEYKEKIWNFDNQELNHSQTSILM